jgi:vacuolar-type H+-ATPase subunit I/STV1
MNNEKRFDVITGKKNELPMISVIDKNYRNFSSKDQCPWFLWVSIPLHNKREDGLSVSQEDEVLEKFEELVADKMMFETNIFYVGRLTWNGFRELFYYLSDAEKANKVLQKLVEDHPLGIGFQYEIKKDVGWSKVAEMFGWE